MKLTSLFLTILLLASERANGFKLLVISDIHAGSATLTNEWAATDSYIQSNLPAVVIIPGDVYEQGAVPGTTNYGSIVDPITVFTSISNWIHLGVCVFASNGNHDADDTNSFATNSLNLNTNRTTFCTTGAQWNNFLGTNIFGLSPYFVGTRYSNDTRWMWMLYTNSGISFVIVSIPWATNLASFYLGNNTFNIDAAYNDSIAWASNVCALYPDHTAIIVTHHMLNYWSALSFWDTGLTLTPGGGTYTNIGPANAVFDDGLMNVPNPQVIIFSGHNRGTLATHFTKLVNNHWDVIEQWDTQGFTPHTEMFAELDFEPAMKRCFVNAYDISQGRYLTNGEWRTSDWGGGLQNGVHLYQPPYQYNYSFPLYGTKNVFRLR